MSKFGDMLNPKSNAQPPAPLPSNPRPTPTTSPSAFESMLQPNYISTPVPPPAPTGPGPVSEQSGRPPSRPQASGLPCWLRGDMAIIVIGFLIGTMAVHFGFFSNSKLNAISSVLKQNATLQNHYNNERHGINITTGSDIDHLAQITQDYASQLKTINVSGCPPDFRNAFVGYINKVANLADALSQQPHVTTDGEAVLIVLAIAAIAQQGGEKGLIQAGQDLADKNNTVTAYVQQCEQCNREVVAAAGRVDSIAIKYGVRCLYHRVP